MKSDYIGSDETCRNTPEEILHSTKQFVVLRTTCKLTDYICFNEEFWPFLDRNGFILHPHLKSGADIRKTVYSFLYNQVIKLQPDLAEGVVAIKKKLHWDDYYIIGIQIRTGKLGIKDAPNHFLEVRDIDLFSRYALIQTEKAMNMTTKPVKWYVACDNRMVKAKLSKTYPKYYMTNSCTLSHSNKDLERSVRSSGLVCALYDSYLLSAVDEAIITAKSTFGILAVNRSPRMKRIQIMKGDWKKLVQEKWYVCYRQYRGFILILAVNRYYRCIRIQIRMDGITFDLDSSSYKESSVMYSYRNNISESDLRWI